MLKYLHVASYGTLDRFMGGHQLPQGQNEDALVLCDLGPVAAILRS